MDNEANRHDFYTIYRNALIIKPNVQSQTAVPPARRVIGRCESHEYDVLGSGAETNKHVQSDLNLHMSAIEVIV